MHVLFLHRNFPAQFGHIAQHLIQHHGFRCTFVSEKPAGMVGEIERIQYTAKGGAREQTHYCARTFENQIWHTHAVYEALRDRPGIQPDLVVAHSGFTSSLFLRELYPCPIINYFEYFYYTSNSEMDFRSDLAVGAPIDLMRARARNALLLLDLQNCDAGYTPTQWQHSRLPSEFHAKVSPVFDGIDTDFWKPIDSPARKIATWNLPDDKKIVTYGSRGMEPMRGFDIFMRIAKRLCDERDDIIIVVVGEDRIAYGRDPDYTGGNTFKQWILANDDFDLQRILFTGRLPPPDLVRLFSLSDLHIYLTAPFILSWSLMDALACGTTVLASDTRPVQEMITHGKNGLLAPFFDVERFVELAQEVLNDPDAYGSLGANGIEFIRDGYSLDVCLPRMLELYESVSSGR